MLRFANQTASDSIRDPIILNRQITSRGRGLSEILEDRYVQNRLTVDQQRRLLDRPEVVHSLGDDAVEQTRRELESIAGG